MPYIPRACDSVEDGAQCRAWRGCARVVLACTRLTTRRVYTVFLSVIYIIPIICRRRRPSAVVIVVERGSLCATHYTYIIYINNKYEDGCRRRSSRQGVLWWVHAHIIILYIMDIYIIYTPVSTMCGCCCCCTAQRRRRFFFFGGSPPSRVNPVVNRITPLSHCPNNRCTAVLLTEIAHRSSVFCHYFYAFVYRYQYAVNRFIPRR